MMASTKSMIIPPAPLAAWVFDEDRSSIAHIAECTTYAQAAERAEAPPSEAGGDPAGKPKKDLTNQEKYAMDVV
jgi:hypothetical protein